MVPKGPYRCTVLYRYSTVTVLFVIIGKCFILLNGIVISEFYSPMTLLDNGEHVFIRDCVSCAHPMLSSVTCLVTIFPEGNEKV